MAVVSKEKKRLLKIIAWKTQATKKNSKINKIKVSEKGQESRYPSLRKTHETGYRRNLRKKNQNWETTTTLKTRKTKQVNVNSCEVFFLKLLDSVVPCVFFKNLFDIVFLLKLFDSAVDGVILVFIVCKTLFYFAIFFPFR